MTLTPTSTTTFVVNGQEVAVRADHPHLLAALREELDVTSPKDGCSPSGQCGACTVLLDGKSIQSCLVSLEKASSKEVTTLEGFDPVERDRLATAFSAAGALQCGFCTPGFVMASVACLEKHGTPDREQVVHELSGNICRCGTYPRIFDAVEKAANGGRR